MTRFRYKTKRVESWKEAKHLFSNEFCAGWIFRGHGCSHWTLKSSLERLVDPRMDLANFERNLVNQFERFAGQYLSSGQIPTDHLAWLALMQHYGAPTRLLDWTYSPYVAAFFALERSTSDSAVWVLSKKQVDDAGRAILDGVAEEPPVILGWSNAKLADEILRHKPLGVFALEPYKQHERLRIQQGLFVLGGDPAKSFLQNLVGMCDLETEACVCKLVLPLKIRMDALADLELMNITRASLFPGLDGFAQSMAQRIERAFGKRNDPVFTSYLTDLRNLGFETSEEDIDPLPN